MEEIMQNISIDGVEYDITNATKKALEQLRNLSFVNEQILQRRNELQVAETAKIGYTLALKRELNKIEN